jgi:hypothetical protein
MLVLGIDIAVSIVSKPRLRAYRKIFANVHTQTVNKDGGTPRGFRT